MEMAIMCTALGLGYLITNPEKRQRAGSVKFNKVDYQSNTLPVEMTDPEEPLSGPGGNLFTNSRFSSVEDTTGTPLNYVGDGISLTGKPIDRNNFHHNNQVPFFGANVKQNVDEHATSSRIDTFTGQDKNYQHKREQNNFFAPEANVSNPYGAANFSDDIQNRYIPSIMRNGEAPIQPQNVGPGLNKGYTAEGSGGFQQAETRDYVMPKNVDELRPKNRPKISYQGRIIKGHGELTRGELGQVETRGPARTYENTPDRWFTTTGAVIKDAKRAKIAPSKGKRQKTTKRRRINPACAVGAKRSRNRALLVQKSNRTERAIKTSEMDRHRGATGQWNVKHSQGSGGAGMGIDLSDYGRGSGRNVETMRSLQGESKHVGQATQMTKGNLVHNKQAPRRTRKENFIGNPRWAGNVAKGAGCVQKGKIHDPNHAPRKTMKETLVEKTRAGNINGTTKKSYVYDPRHKARTTIKETLICNSRKGNLTGKSKPGPRDPNHRARTTVKETLLTKSRLGGAKGNLAQRKRLEEKAKTTNREGTLVGHTANACGANKLQDSSDVNMKTKRYSDINSKYISERGVNAPVSLNASIPNMSLLGKQRSRSSVSNEVIGGRLDRSVLDSLRSNPYSRSLN